VRLAEVQSKIEILLFASGESYLRSSEPKQISFPSQLSQKQSTNRCRRQRDVNHNSTSWKWSSISKKIMKIFYFH
ncbi:unnamed protein product, partial [Hymenolepis diminuta]